MCLLEVLAPENVEYRLPGGVGSSNQISGELFKMLAGVNMVHVPYRGASPALADLIGGQVQVMFVAVTSSIEAKATCAAP